MDGYASVTFIMNGQPFPSSLLVSNKALYQLPPHSFQTLICRLDLSSLTAMVLTFARDLLVLVADPQEDWVLKSDQLEDLAKAIQTVYKEKTGGYLPAYSFENMTAISSWRTSLTANLIAESRSSDNKRLISVLVTKGEIGENHILAVKCHSCETHPKSLLFFLSHKAIYSLLDPSYKVELKIPLRKVDALSTEGEYLIVSTSGHEYRWQLPYPFRILSKLESAVESEKLRINTIIYPPL